MYDVHRHSHMCSGLILPGVLLTTKVAKIQFLDHYRRFADGNSESISFKHFIIFVATHPMKRRSEILRNEKYLCLNWKERSI